MKQLLLQDKALHVQYELVLRGRGEYEALENKMVMHIYKKGTKQHLVMGDTQEIIQEGKLLLVVNHVMQTIQLQEDTSSKINDNSPLGDLAELVDSATTVELLKKGGELHYTMRFATDFIYTKIELRFSEKTQLLNGLYAEFSDEYEEPYKAMWVNYQEWDLAWKPATSFPPFSKFVKKEHTKFQVQDAWNKYQFFQPERGILKL